MVEIDRSLGRRLDIYIERWNEIYTQNQYSKNTTKDNLIQSLLTEKLRDIRELIIDDNGEKRAYYAEIDRRQHCAFGSVLFSHGMMKFDCENDPMTIDQHFKDVILRHEEFVKARSRSYVIID